MLQIISGKFFKDGPRHVYDGKGIIYSNLFWGDEIKTCVAEMHPVGTYAEVVVPYVICYKNQIEKNGVGNLLRIGDSEIVKQFQLLCIFGLKAFFDIDKTHVEYLCRQKPADSDDKYLASIFAPEFFKQHKISTIGEVEDFQKFVKKTISMPRLKYKAAITCLDNFSNALQVLGYNFELAYSMLVYCLESLAQSFDNYSPNWQDYEQPVRNRLDPIFSKLPADDAGRARSALLQSAHLKLAGRFIGFIENHVTDDYFLRFAAGVSSALKKSELRRALRNVYNMRSKFTHRLLTIQDPIKIKQIAQSDVFHWDNEPYLTFNGLVRLSHHAILNFINAQESIETEQYPWAQDLPGIVTMELAPQYWIGETKNISSVRATKRFSGFLSHLQQVFNSKEKIIDIRALLATYENMIASAPAEEQRAMLGMYYLFNAIVSSADRMPNYTQVISKNRGVLDSCCIEMMIARLLVKEPWSWNLEDCVQAFEQYVGRKFSASSLSVPSLFELALIVELGNQHFRKKDIQQFNHYLDRALFDAAGRREIQEVIKKSKEEAKELPPEKIWESKWA